MNKSFNVFTWKLDIFSPTKTKCCARKTRELCPPRIGAVFLTVTGQNTALPKKGGAVFFFSVSHSWVRYFFILNHFRCLKPLRKITTNYIPNYYPMSCVFSPFRLVTIKINYANSTLAFTQRCQLNIIHFLNIFPAYLHSSPCPQLGAWSSIGCVAVAFSETFRATSWGIGFIGWPCEPPNSMLTPLNPNQKQEISLLLCDWASVISTEIAI